MEDTVDFGSILNEWRSAGILQRNDRFWVTVQFTGRQPPTRLAEALPICYDPATSSDVNPKVQTCPHRWGGEDDYAGSHTWIYQ